MKKINLLSLLFLMCMNSFAQNYSHITVPSDKERTEMMPRQTETKPVIDEDDNVYEVLFEKKRTYGLNPGLKGIYSVSIGQDIKEGGKDMMVMALSITEGIQFNHHLYIGIGMNNFGTRDEYESQMLTYSNLFAHVRVTGRTRLTPIFDIKGGYKPFYQQTPYWATGAGVRYGINKKFGINLTFTYENNKVKHYSTAEYNKYVTSWNHSWMLCIGVDY